MAASSAPIASQDERRQLVTGLGHVTSGAERRIASASGVCQSANVEDVYSNNLSECRTPNGLTLSDTIST